MHSERWAEQPNTVRHFSVTDAVGYSLTSFCVLLQLLLRVELAGFWLSLLRRQLLISVTVHVRPS